ncbi:hypothetical protein [Desulfogranum japonicum]|uniref:hypothetical protein n=1 Tax=Desulfogranum japonicum TaxID=231447 RepID=UPI0004193AF4|nr:hypothetical protein [Desulfogranum japonicum]
MQYWNKPKSRSIALFNDIRLYFEALELAHSQEYITVQELIDEMPQRVKGLLFVRNQSSRGMTDLVREFRNFGWLKRIKYSSSQTNNSKYALTNEGEKAYRLSKSDKVRFIRYLTRKMHNVYTIPGWFVDRLWTINPEGQGEVIVPTPVQSWRPHSKAWEDNSWSKDLINQTANSHEIIQRLSPGSLPIPIDAWISLVEISWNRLSNLKQRKVAKDKKDDSSIEKRKMKTFAPRRRLAMAMQEAAVSFFFSNKFSKNEKRDFAINRPPLKPRTYMAWCPRLEALELLFYTDSHPKAPGRIIFPTSVFRISNDSEKFEKLDIQNPVGKTLYLHTPKWDSLRDSFTEILVAEHHKTFSRVGSLYVPLLDVRDEVCRQLRLSAEHFDKFLHNIIRESLSCTASLSISLETDIREDQRAAHRLIRRPVIFNGTPHSLIAITQPRSNKEN